MVGKDVLTEGFAGLSFRTHSEEKRVRTMRQDLRVSCFQGDAKRAVIAIEQRFDDIIVTALRLPCIVELLAPQLLSIRSSPITSSVRISQRFIPCLIARANRLIGKGFRQWAWAL